jgi:2'-5' RNA ligase
VRLFLAIELPAAARAVLEEVSRKLRSHCPGWRWAPPESIHLTLRFLGQVRAEDEPALRPAWREAAGGHGAVRFHLEGLGTFPGPSRPRILWVGVNEVGQSGRLGALADDLERAARALGFPAETREFRPHLTLARAARGARAVPPPPSFTIGAVEVVAEQLHLFESVLTPHGARYTCLDSYSVL